MSLKSPSEALLKKVERELQKLPPRSQRAVGGGIYMRLDSSGRRRFQFRTRGVGAQPAGTYDSWADAVAARDECEARAEEASALGGLHTAGALRKMTVRQYAPNWWKRVLNDLDVTTQLDYEYGLKMALEVAGGFTLEQLERAPLLVDEIKARLKRLKTRPKDAKQRPGVFTKSAADKALKVLSAICSHAVERNVMTRNPFAGIEYFDRKRGANGKKSNGHRAIKKSEVLHPRTVALAGLGMRGSIAEIEQGRLIPELIAFEGMRPQDICAMRHRWWRDENGPRTHILLEDAIKDIRGHLVVGEAKTGEREPTLWTAVAEQLERVYQAQGCPSLDALVIPNALGKYLDWGNYRRVWYRALFNAGLSAAPAASASGAFEPYLLRHIGVVTMSHAQRPAEVGGGAYSRYEVARHHGHTVDTLDKVYADIPNDLLGIAGLTMNEIVRQGRREAWGPIPGDSDYEEILYTTKEASRLTGVSVTALCARCQRGGLPSTMDGCRYLVSDHHLVMIGLLPPRHRR